jgi:RND family efflux transporter MFP subunit
MKTNTVITVLLFILIVSCSGKKDNFETVLESGDSKLLHTKKSELLESQRALQIQINEINNKLDEIAGTYKLQLVSTFSTTEELFKHYVELQGNVTTKNLVVVNSEFAGLLKSVNVKEGQKVSKGQILARIDDGGLSQQLSQMQIQADLAKTTFERQERLWQQNIGSEIQYLQTKSAYESQLEAINQMKQQLAKTTLTAPFSGTIDDIITDQGTIVAPGTPIFRLVSLTDMFVEVDVPETYLKDVTTGKEVIVEFPVLNMSVNSVVRQAGSFINAANRTYKVEVAIPNGYDNIKPNLTAKLKINDYTSRNAILIPQDIISEDASGDEYIYTLEVVNDNTGLVKRTNIKTGKTQGDIIEVIEGLNPNTIVIQEGARSVKNGQKVEVKQI